MRVRTPIDLERSIKNDPNEVVMYIDEERALVSAHKSDKESLSRLLLIQDRKLNTTMTKYDIESMADILGGHGEWFTAKLLRVISAADKNNKKKLYQGFPEEVDAVCVFQTGLPFDPEEDRENE